MQNPAGIMGTMYAPTSGGFFLPQAIQNQRPAPFMPTAANIPGAQIRNMAPRWNNVGGYSKDIVWFSTNKEGTLMTFFKANFTCL